MMPSLPSPDRDDQSASPSATPADESPNDSSAAGNAPVSSDATMSEARLRVSALGSGLLARQPTPDPEAVAAVPKVCPQCGTEYETGSRFCVKDGASLRPKAGDDPLVGRVIADRYLILSAVGEGGMGRVYLAEHLKINRQCAVKVMNPSLVNDHESAARFAREASNAAKILHPNVAAVFDFGESDRIVYLVMEYVDGEPLSRILARDGVLEPRRAIEIARQIADGLSAAHDLGIFHRDLKPDNVIVARGRDGRDQPKIVDFGIAKAASEAPQDALTRSGLVIGTPEYMSPEQLLGDPIDGRTDLYSLGCILYQMLTGVSPFADESREQMIRRRLHEPAPRVREVTPELPRRLETTLTRLLARSPADRLATAAEARAALDPAVTFAEWGPQANPVARPTPHSAPTAKIERQSADSSPRRTIRLPPRRTHGGGVGVGVGIGAAILLAAVLMWSRLRETPPVAPSASDSVAAVTPLPSPGGGSSASPRGQANAATPVDTSGLVKPPPAVVSETLALRRPLQAYSDAIRTGDINQVRAVYPGVTEKFGGFLADIEHIRTRPTFGPPTINGDRAELEFTLVLRYDSRSTKNQTARLDYHAVLARHDSVWTIQELRTKG